MGSAGHGWARRMGMNPNGAARAPGAAAGFTLLAWTLCCSNPGCAGGRCRRTACPGHRTALRPPDLTKLGHKSPSGEQGGYTQCCQRWGSRWAQPGGPGHGCPQGPEPDAAGSVLGAAWVYFCCGLSGSHILPATTAGRRAGRSAWRQNPGGGQGMEAMSCWWRAGDGAGSTELPCGEESGGHRLVQRRRLGPGVPRRSCCNGIPGRAFGPRGNFHRKPLLSSSQIRLKATLANPWAQQPGSVEARAGALCSLASFIQLGKKKKTQTKPKQTTNSQLSAHGKTRRNNRQRGGRNATRSPPPAP